MVKLARSRYGGKVVRRQTAKRTDIILNAQNEYLSNQIAKVMFKENTEVLKVNKAGVVTNLDYNNPNHKRWLED